MIDRPHWLHPGDPHGSGWTPACPANRGEVYIARRFPAARRSVPRERVLFARHGYNNPVKYVDPSGHRVDPFALPLGYPDLEPLPFQEKLEFSRITYEDRFDEFRRETRHDSIYAVDEFVYSAIPPLKRADLLAWALRNVLSNQDRILSATDALVVVLQNIETGLFILATSGDVAYFEPGANFYSVGYELQIESSEYGTSHQRHISLSNSALQSALDADPSFATMIEELIPGITGALKSGKNPPGCQWHHHVEPGIMQLVPAWEHAPGSKSFYLLHPSGRGGWAIWAVPAGARQR